MSFSQQIQPEAGPSTPRTRSPDQHSALSRDGSTSDDAEQSILHPGAPLPSCLSRSSVFFQVLTAPYRPSSGFPLWKPTVAPRDGHAARCEAMVRWAKAQDKEDEVIDAPPPSSSSGLQPVRKADLVLYPPHGHWAWTHGLPIDDPKTLLVLQSGAQCSASIDSGSIAGREIKYICRKWDMSRQDDWEGFYSELALYRSERYLKPLQGDVVPHLIGVHVMPQAVSVTMELPHRSFWIEASPCMPNILKERVIAAFEKIHAHGVLHGDPELRHMLIGADGRVTIIDFGMSSAIREYDVIGLEQVEPEEFRLEMRQVKYKLDYMGARKKEADKTADHMKRVEKNERLELLWARRRAGERTGPITEEIEEDPKEYRLDPPVSAEDLEEDWNVAADNEPVRVVVPGQREAEVAREVEAFMGILGRMRTVPRGEEAIEASSSSSPPRYPCYPSPWTSTGDRVHMWYSDEPEDGEDFSHAPGVNATKSVVAERIQQENIHQCYQYGLPHDKLVGVKARNLSFGRMMRRRERERYGTRHVSLVRKGAIRRRYLRVKRMKNGHIAKLGGGENMSGVEMGPKEMAAIDFGEGEGTLKDVPEGPRILQQEEYRMIAEARRQAVVRSTKAPRGILKRRREDEGMAAFEKPTNGLSAVNASTGDEDEGLPRKRRRTSGRASGAPIGRRPGEILRGRLGCREEEEEEEEERSRGMLPFVRRVIGTLVAWTS